MKEYPFIDYQPDQYDEKQIARKAAGYRAYINKRRSVRDFSSKQIPGKVIEDLLMSANAAPSGANKQPWTFCAISKPELKKQIRQAAEKEEYENYHGRMPEEWLQDLAPLETDWHKEFLEIAPWLIVVFKKAYEIVGGEKRKNYYVNESVGLACGFLLTAIHNAGLVALTHTPSPMNFLQLILKRPENERPFLLIPIGYPANNTRVPDIHRKKSGQIIVYY